MHSFAVVTCAVIHAAKVANGAAASVEVKVRGAGSSHRSTAMNSSSHAELPEQSHVHCRRTLV